MVLLMSKIADAFVNVSKLSMTKRAADLRLNSIDQNLKQGGQPKLKLDQNYLIFASFESP